MCQLELLDSVDDLVDAVKNGTSYTGAGQFDSARWQKSFRIYLDKWGT